MSFEATGNRSLVRSDDGLTSGIFIPAVAGRERANPPLIVCIHGGGCNALYFDLQGCSTAQAAHARGCPVLLVNRPGYGGNELPDVERPLADTAPMIRAFIDTARRDHLPGSDALMLIGHSIGGAIALTLAATRGDWPLLGVAVSGIGDESPFAGRPLAIPPGEVRVQPPAALTDALFFNPDRALNHRAVMSLRAAAEPWLVSELLDVVHHWPEEWPRVAERIDVPVHFRLAEHERIWASGQAVVSRMAARMTSARRVDAALLEGGGHLYEVYKRGPELVASQLDFLDACARST